VQDESLFDPVPQPAAGAVGSSIEVDLADALLGSPVYRQRRGDAGDLPDDRVRVLVRTLVAGHGRAGVDVLASRAGVPRHRIVPVVNALRRLLQVEGYPVLAVDADGSTVVLDVPLLVEQFGLPARPDR
jgi:hypothetical protein